MYEELQQWIDESRRIVFFGGAGVSTESGIPDFRSQDGLYHQQFAYPPEEILSHTFFARHPEEFYRFYRAKMLPLDAQPNDAHRFLAQLEAGGAWDDTARLWHEQAPLEAAMSFVARLGRPTPAAPTTGSVGSGAIASPGR